METQAHTAKGSLRATMSLKVRRAGSDQWEDGPEVNGVVALPLITRIKLRVFGGLIKLMTRLQSKLEEMQNHE